MQRLLYTSLYYLLTPVLFLRLLFKHQKSNNYKEERQSLRLLERLGVFTQPSFYLLSDTSLRTPILIHTVSVGEFLDTAPLIRQLMQEFPHYPFVITCTTTTGSAQIMKTFSRKIQQGKVFHVYLPYDLPGSMKRFLKKIQPCLVLVMVKAGERSVPTPASPCPSEETAFAFSLGWFMAETAHTCGLSDCQRPSVPSSKPSESARVQLAEIPKISAVMIDGFLLMVFPLSC